MAQVTFPQSPQSRYRGCLVGLALGDALGAPYEFQVAPDPDAHFHRGHFGTEPGAPTDDSQLAGILADSLLANAGWNRSHYIQRLVGWKQSGPPDIGLQTSLAIRNLGHGRPAPSEASSGGNGALMCIAPLALAYPSDLYELEKLATEFSNLTHPHPDSVEACVRFTGLLRNIVLGHGSTAVWRDLPISPSGAHMGWARLTCTIAENALATTCGDPTEDLLDVIRLGGDTDTNAAVAGALLGAYYGLDAWSPSLDVASLEGLSTWVFRADALLALAQKVA